MSAQDVKFLVSAGKIQSACLNNWDDVAAAIAAALVVTPDKAYSTIYTGTTDPTSDVGPWFRDTDSLLVWDQDEGEYVDIRLAGLLEIGMWAWWPGTIAKANTLGDRWAVCDGRALSRSIYATLFDRIGTIYGPGDGSLTFNIPTIENVMIAAAQEDDSGVAKTSIADPTGLGTALLQARAYTQHVHGTGASSVAGQGHTAGNSYTGVEKDPASDSSAAVATRVLPPFLCQTPVMRIK